jgi:hypothetical protein
LIADNGVVIKENFAQLLILDATGNKWGCQIFFIALR